MAESHGPARPPSDNRPGPHFEIEVIAHEGHLKEGRLVQHGKEFTVFCDEGPQLGGRNSAPSPLAYFSLGVGF